MVLRKSFYIRWSAGRSPRVHEVNPGRDPSTIFIFLSFHALTPIDLGCLGAYKMYYVIFIQHMPIYLIGFKK